MGKSRVPACSLMYNYFVKTNFAVLFDYQVDFTFNSILDQVEGISTAYRPTIFLPVANVPSRVSPSKAATAENE